MSCLAAGLVVVGSACSADDASSGRASIVEGTESPDACPADGGSAASTCGAPLLDRPTLNETIAAISDCAGASSYAPPYYTDPIGGYVKVFSAGIDSSSWAFFDVATGRMVQECGSSVNLHRTECTPACCQFPDGPDDCHRHYTCHADSPMITPCADDAGAGDGG